jgi:hypothetical protein
MFFFDMEIEFNALQPMTRRMEFLNHYVAKRKSTILGSTLMLAGDGA